MKTTMRTETVLTTILAAAVCGAFLGCAAPPKPGTFKTPEEAVQAIGEVAATGDAKKAEEILGAEGMEVLKSGDEAADKADAEMVRTLITQKVAFEDASGGGKVAVLGNDAWPFPIPLVQEGDRWRFDMEAGKDEIVNRRVGRNELSTLASLHAVVDAQHEYAASGKDGNPPCFAQKFLSDEGKMNGLYWAAADGAPESPLGPLVAEAASEGYAAAAGGSGETKTPYHGYHFRLLTSQGKNAPGGERSFLNPKGLLTGGFAVVAWPAKYGNSGVMTFEVSERGVVYQKDLGADTETAAAAITAFDPDATWATTAD